MAFPFVHTVATPSWVPWNLGVQPEVPSPAIREELASQSKVPVCNLEMSWSNLGIDFIFVRMVLF